MYQAQNAADTYKRQGIMTASPAELIVLLYDGCMKEIRQGVRSIEKKEYEAANERLQKAQRILNELALNLDMRYEISQNLLGLYEYSTAQIAEANRLKNAETAKEVLALLLELRAAWAEIAKNETGAVAAAYEGV